jgi:hypothetical protein
VLTRSTAVGIDISGWDTISSKQPSSAGVSLFNEDESSTYPCVQLLAAFQVPSSPLCRHELLLVTTFYHCSERVKKSWDINLIHLVIIRGSEDSLTYVQVSSPAPEPVVDRPRPAIHPRFIFSPRRWSFTDILTASATAINAELIGEESTYLFTYLIYLPLFPKALQKRKGR